MTCTYATRLLQSRHPVHCLLECKLVDRPDIGPLLRQKACVGMKIVSYLDNDKINKPETGGAPVYALEEGKPLSIQQLVHLYPLVFGSGVGCLEEPYHIKLDADVTAVQHPPRRVPVPLRKMLKGTLDDLTTQGILALVKQPTQWVSSMVVVLKKNGALRICLDPQDLNRAIQQEHYPLPTIEDIATRLHGTRVFSVLDVSKGLLLKECNLQVVEYSGTSQNTLTTCTLR